MQKKIPIFYSAILLTMVNLLLRMAGTTFQVYISTRIGAAGVGLLQLTMSVGSLAMVAGSAGIRTAAMYLTAEEIGSQQHKNVRHVLSGCFLYSILFSGLISILLFSFAPVIGERWIGDIRTTAALRLLAAFLPCSCLCGVMTGYFTAANRIGTLSMVEIAEQLCSMAVTISALTLWAGQDPGRACLCVILGSGAGTCLTFTLLVLLRVLERSPVSSPVPIARRLTDAALPLAAADILKSGINTTENLMVPRRLSLNRRVSDPLAAFGTVSGMVFPILMFPSCILFSLAELLIPELARCAAGKHQARIRYLVRRSLRVSLLYGTLFSGLIFLLSEQLCLWLYDSPAAGSFLKLYAPMIPMLYCDAIVDAMTKGLGQQKICVRYNILTSAMDVAFLYLLLPRFGMMGYLLSFFVTHLLNFLLSARRLLKITGQTIPLHVPVFTGGAAILSVFLCSTLNAAYLRILFFPALFFSILFLLKIIGKEDITWLKGLIKK